MASRTILIIALLRVQTIYIIYIYIYCLCHLHVYIVKEVASFRDIGQSMGMVHKRTRTRATDQKEDFKLQLILTILVYSRETV